MERLDPEKLFVQFRPGVTPTGPVIGRKYTLTHSDVTADLFLTIGLEYAFDKINQMRDEVLAEWILHDENPLLHVSVYVDGRFGPYVSYIRNRIFRRELPLALEAIRYGDEELFTENPLLDQAPIWVSFNSEIPEYSSFENWGTPEDYK
jgi:hypothetical protein